MFFTIYRGQEIVEDDNVFKIKLASGTHQEETFNSLESARKQIDNLLDAPQKLALRVPFEGFYESTHSAMLDSWLEREQEYLAEEHDATLDQLQELSERYYDAVNWPLVRIEYAKKYCGVLQELLKAEGFNIGIDFLELKSPREYNFETDAIYANVSVNDIKLMLNSIPREDWLHYVEERCTSHEGFISFYSPRFEDWEDDLALWGEARLGMVFEAFLIHLFKDMNEVLSAYSLLEDMSGSGELDNLILENANKDFVEYYNSLFKDQP